MQKLFSSIQQKFRFTYLLIEIVSLYDQPPFFSQLLAIKELSLHYSGDWDKRQQVIFLCIISSNLVLDNLLFSSFICVEPFLLLLNFFLGSSHLFESIGIEFLPLTFIFDRVLIPLGQ